MTKDIWDVVNGVVFEWSINFAEGQAYYKNYGKVVLVYGELFANQDFVVEAVLGNRVSDPANREMPGSRESCPCKRLVKARPPGGPGWNDAFGAGRIRPWQWRGPRLDPPT